MSERNIELFLCVLILEGLASRGEYRINLSRQKRQLTYWKQRKARKKPTHERIGRMGTAT